MWARALVAALAIALAAPALATAAADPLSVKHNRIVDARGRQVILHGANTVFKRAPYYPPLTAADFRRMRSLGLQRDPARRHLGRPRAPARAQIDQDYINRLQAIVDARGPGALLGPARHAPGPLRRAVRRRGRAGVGGPGRRHPVHPGPRRLRAELHRRRRSGGRSRASGPTGTASAPSTCTRSRRWPSASPAATPCSATTCSTSRSASSSSGRRAGLPPDPAAATQFLMPLYDQLVPGAARGRPQATRPSTRTRSRSTSATRS